jgi:hypothetical protein
MRHVWHNLNGREHLRMLRRSKDSIKVTLERYDVRVGTGSYSSAQGPMASYRHANAHLGSIKCTEFIDQFCYFQLLQKGSSLLNYSMVLGTYL